MEYYEEDEGVSLGQIFKVIFRRWKLLLIITFAIFVLGVLGSQLIYNKLKTNYTTTVEYEAVGINEGTYFDNSKFNYRDMIKLNALEAVKASDENFSNIDVSDISKNEKISITRNTKDNGGVQQVTFTITVAGKYFKDAGQAKDFLYQIALQPVNESIKIAENENHKIYLKAYNEAKDFESQIDYLLKEIDYLYTSYSDLIKMYGDVDSQVSSTDNEKISSYQVLLATKFGKNDSAYKTIQDLKTKLETKNYVKDFAKNKEALENKRASLLKDIEENSTVISALEESIKKYNGGTDVDISAHPNDAFTPFTSQIVDLTIKNTKLENEVAIIDAQLDQNGGDKNEITAFEGELNSIYNDLYTFSDTYKNVSTSVVKNNSSVEYTNKAIEANGGLGLIISCLLFLVGGFVVAAIVNLIIDRKYLKETEPKTSKKEEAIEAKETKTEE